MKKNSMNKIAKIFALCSVLVFFMVGQAFAKDKIRFGYSASLSGGYSQVGEMVKAGYTIWGEMVNDKGGIYVKDLDQTLPVEMIHYDDKSDPSTAAKLYEKLITVDKVDFVLSPWGSSIGFPVSGICQKYKMPIAYIFVSSDPVFSQGYDYAFCTIQLASRHEWSPIDLIKHKNELKNIQYIATKELYGITTAKGGVEYAKSQGLNPSYEEVEKGVKDFTPLITKMKSKGIQAISTGIYEGEFFLLMRQMQELAFYPKFIYASHGTDLPEYWETFGKTGENACAGGFYNKTWDTFENKEFVERYKKETGSYPTHYAATIAGGQIMKQAIEKAGTLNKEKVKKILETEEFKCVLYPRVKYENEGKYTNLNKYAFTGILQWQEGNLLTIFPSSIAEASFQYPMEWNR